MKRNQLVQGMDQVVEVVGTGVFTVEKEILFGIICLLVIISSTVSVYKNVKYQAVTIFGKGMHFVFRPSNCSVYLLLTTVLSIMWHILY